MGSACPIFTTNVARRAGRRTGNCVSLYRVYLYAAHGTQSGARRMRAWALFFGWCPINYVIWLADNPARHFNHNV